MPCSIFCHDTHITIHKEFTGPKQKSLPGSASSKLGELIYTKASLQYAMYYTYRSFIEMVCYLSGCRGFHPPEAPCAWKSQNCPDHLFLKYFYLLLILFFLLFTVQIIFPISPQILLPFTNTFFYFSLSRSSFSFFLK